MALPSCPSLCSGLIRGISECQSERVKGHRSPRRNGVEGSSCGRMNTRLFVCRNALSNQTSRSEKAE